MSQTIPPTAARPTLTRAIDTADDESELEGYTCNPYPAAEDSHRPANPVGVILSLMKMTADLSDPNLNKPKPQKPAAPSPNAPASPTKVFIRTLSPASPISLSPQPASPQQSYTPRANSPSSPFQTPPKNPNSVALMA